MRGIHEDIREIKRVAWDTFHMVEDIWVRVDELEVALNFNQEVEDFGPYDHNSGSGKESELRLL